MRFTNSTRFSGAVVLGATVAATLGALLVPGPDAFAAKAAAAARIGRIETPLGLQGTRGAGSNVGIIFNLIDEGRHKTDVEVQYAIDRNGDGLITDGTETPPIGSPPYPNEFRTATEDRLDPRDTRKNKAPQLFTSAGDIGAAHQFVWKSTADVFTERLLTLEYQLSLQGREVADPDNPGSFLFAVGPNGTPVLAGVKVRVRAVRTVPGAKKGRPQKVAGDWAVSAAFGLNNNNAPTITIDSVDSNGVSVPTASDENVLIHWSTYDQDSEDLNGNGVLDVAAGEDIDGDGVLHDERQGVAFDYHRLAANENPATMSAAQIAALSWLPCTRKKGVGDTDSLDSKPGQPLPTTGDNVGVPSAPPGVGRHWVFAWDSVSDVGTVYAKFIFRARAFDQKREHSDFAYLTSPAVQVDNWRIFNPGSDKFAIASLGTPRIGHTVSPIQPALDVNDVLDRGDGQGLLGFQSILVAGGSTTLTGAAVTSVDLMSLNTISAETTTSARVPTAFAQARNFHTATNLDDGRILFVGGFGASSTAPLATTEIFDPKTRTVAAGPNLQFARGKHAAVKLSSGDVAIFGGIGASGAVLNSCELIEFKPYADATGTSVPASSWSVVALPPLATQQHSLHAVLMPDQTVLVTGGIDASGAGVRTAQLLNPLLDNDPATPTTKNPAFIAAPDMLEVRKFGSATALLDGNVLFVGGAGKSSLEVFNWQTRTFEAVSATMQVARGQHVAALLGDGTVLLAGGSGDPDSASPGVTADADVFKIGARNASTSTWAGTLQQVNGDLTRARRLAAASAIDNGRVFVVGGSEASATTATVETFTPTNGSNLAPKCRTILPSSQQSWAYGAPIYYRVTDAEQDRTRVVVQFIDRTTGGAQNWRACSPQSGTIGGDIADATADLTTTIIDDQSLAIDPIARLTPGDHAFVWGMSQDISRPPVGGTAGPYNIRVIPQGAVRGTLGESLPISVLYNTKVVPTILPMENISANRPDVALPAGALTPNQGGDIRINVHLRDIDGGAPDTNGNPASCLFQYALDLNGDGFIKATDNEAFVNMTAKGGAVNLATSANPQTNLQTYFNAAADSDATFGPGHRPASKGWTFFDWDSVRDLGAPVTTFSNVWIQVIPSDADTGFGKSLRNIAGQPAALTIIRHPDALFLKSWRPRQSNNKAAMPINDPIDFTFNGQIEPASATATSVQIFRGTGSTSSQVRGSFGVVNNSATNTSVLTFYPDVQSFNTGAPVFGQTAASTVLFINDTYSIRMPGYIKGIDPRSNPPLPTVPAGATMLRPLGQTVPGQISTNRLVQISPENLTLTDPTLRITTAGLGVYADDGQPVTNTVQSPLSGSQIVKNAGQPGASGVGATSVSFTFSQAIDVNTVKAPNITAKLSSTTTGGTNPATNPVVPGRWTVTNSQTLNGTTVTSTGTLTFVPLLKMPPSTTLVFAWNSGLKAVNGRSPSGGPFSYIVESYSRFNSSVTESFTNQTQNDTLVTTAAWGTEACAIGTLSGGATGVGAGTPTGGSDLTVNNGGTTTLTLATNNYNNITVNKGGTLIFDCQSGPIAVLATGNVTINGTVTFRGKNGVHGHHGFSGSYVIYAGPTTAGTRNGGAGRNGGGAGGNSASSNTTAYRTAGSDGTNGTGTSNTKGQGGQIGTENATTSTARYLYGAGGAGGGGNGTAGLGGGRPMTYSGFTAAAGYGAASTGGATGGDATFANGMTAGGGGGGGGSVNYATSYFHEGGGGGAGAGAATIQCDGAFNLSATGLIDGRGGDGGGAAQGCGAGGGGSGGSLRLISKGKATLDGVIDLRGGNGGAHGYGDSSSSLMAYVNATAEKTARYGGDGGLGRLVVMAPNFLVVDEMRVFGQLIVKPITSLPTSSLTATSPPFGLDGNVTTTVINMGSTSAVKYTFLTVESGATIDLFGSSALQIHVTGSVNIRGTLRLNGASTAVGGFNPAGRTTHPNGQSNQYIQTYYGVNPSYTTSIGMDGNLGGGKGGDGAVQSSNANGREASDGLGPQSNFMAGKHTMNAGTGYNQGSWVMYSGDSGGGGGGSATDGEDGWACFAVSAQYLYTGSSNDVSGVGFSGPSNGRTTASHSTLISYGRRIGAATTDQNALVMTSNLSSFAGSGGGGGNAGGDTYWGKYGSYPGFTMAGLGGGGAGAIGITTPGTLTVASGATIEARGGDGQTPGQGRYWESGSPYETAHAGGGGGSGGTVLLAARDVSLAPTSTSGTGGATFDLRGGMGGGFRSQNQFAGLQAYPEYVSTGAFGGYGGYGTLNVQYVNSLNGGVTPNPKVLVNRWGQQQNTIDSATNTYKTLSGTASYLCPGFASGGTVGQSKWFDLGSISPIVTSAVLTTVINANATFRVEGAQSLPNAVGAGTGDADPANTSGQFIPPASGNVMTGWRWFRFNINFTRTTPPTGSAVAIDDVVFNYTRE